MAIVDEDDVLIAYARATPPAWVKTASGAEAWALLLTVNSTLVVPHIITDCMGVVNAAQAGPSAATGARRMEARIWKEIAEALGHDFSQLRERLVWMPSHETAEAAVTKRKSDGTRVTVTQWRANQLADALAKGPP